MSLLAKLSARTYPAAVSSDQQQPDLDQMLLDLARYGHPRVSLTKQGWYACIEMNTTAEGTSFDVKSEFGHTSPLAAVEQMAKRMHAALAALGRAG